MSADQKHLPSLPFLCSVSTRSMSMTVAPYDWEADNPLPKSGQLPETESPWLPVDDENKLKEVEGWWGRIHQMHRIRNDVSEALKDLQDALKNDASAWGIVCALVMTMGIGLLAVGSNNVYDPAAPNDILISIFVVFTLASSVCALAAIIFASNEYVFWNALPPNLIPKAMLWRFSKLKWYERFFPWMTMSWNFLVIGVLALIFALYGQTTFIAATCSSGSIFLFVVNRNGYLLGEMVAYYEAHIHEPAKHKHP